MPKQRTRAKGFLIVIVVLTGMMVVSQYLETRRPPAEQEAIVARGRVLYASLCQECHGARMEGGRIPATGQDVSPLTGTALRVYFRVMPEGTENWIDY